MAKIAPVSMVLAAALAAACSGSNKQSVDAGPAGPDAFFSLCGHPGDMGNELGVGKFCQTLEDCASNTQATLCSSLGNDPTMPKDNSFFCTIECTMGDGASVCGTNATCNCAAQGCGCSPNSCPAGL